LGIPVPHTVHINADGTTRNQRLFGQNVRDVLAASTVVLHTGDRLTPGPDTPVWSGMEIEVVRAVPIEVRIGGQRRQVHLAAKTVGEALRALRVSLESADRVYPSLGAALTPAMRVTVERRQWHAWVESRPVPFTSQVVNDAALFKGNETVRSAGRPGLQQRTVKVLYADDRPAMMVPGPWAVTVPPAPKVVAVGTRATIASRGAFAGREYMVFEATAYYPGPNNFGGGVGPRTAIGMIAGRGVVAVDPSVIPLGTHLYIEGYGYAVAGDTGGNIRGRRVDLCYNTYDEAIRFGRQQVRVFILDSH